MIIIKIIIMILMIITLGRGSVFFASLQIVGDNTLIIILNILKMIKYQNVVSGGILCTILYPQLVYLEKVVTRKISKDAIQIYLKRSNRTMVLILLYLCVLSYTK